jgi:ribosomal protein S18 acetylase RimI-like enzyme
MDPVEIRPALPSELPAIGDLRVAAYRADGFLSAASAYAATLHDLGTAGDGEVLAAVAHGTILGTVMLQPWPHAGEIAQRPGEAEIRALAVAPHMRGRGIGRALVSAVTDLARRRGIRQLLLLTQDRMLTAQRLYSDAGFCRLPERDWAPQPEVFLLAYGKVLTPALA